MSATFNNLLLLERAFGKRLAVAFYLGYTERQYYNIRRQAKGGRPLKPRLEETIRLKTGEIVKTQSEESTP